MNQDLIPDKSEKKVSKLFIPNQILKSYGCVNCVWKGYHQCPEGFTKPEDSLEKGYCKELVDFFVILSEGGDSISAVKEKFHIYTQEVQALSDHNELQQMIEEYKRLQEEEHDDLEKYEKKLTMLEMKINAYKIWWMRLSELVVKGLSRIADREIKSDTTINVEHKISLSQIHQLVDKARKQVDYETDWVNGTVIDVKRREDEDE